MATSYDRRVNLYINIDGKEVENKAKVIRAEMAKIVNAQANMTIGSKEYQESTNKIIKLKSILSQHRDNITETKSAWSGLIDQAKGLLPALSLTALAGAAVAAFTKIKDSTHATADAFEFAMAGMGNGLDHLFKILATGDFTDFTKRIKEAIEVGHKYASMLDEVDDKTRALSMVESDARGEELKLEEKLKNKGLGRAAQIQAGKDRIKLEKKLSLERQNIANERFDAEVLIAQQQSGLSRDQLIQVAKDIDSQEKLNAQAYKDKVDSYKKMRDANFQPSTGGDFGPGMSGGNMRQLPDTPEMIRLKSEIDATENSIKEYAGFMDQYDVLTLEQQQKFVSAYAQRNEAINSAPENLKKVITRVNNLLAGVEDNGQAIEDKTAKAQKEASDKALEQLDIANNERTSKITDQYIAEGWSDEQFKSEQATAENAYLVLKKAILENYGQSTVDVDKQINDKRIQAQQEFNKLSADQQKEFNDIQNQISQDTYNENADLFAQAGKELLDNITDDEKKEKDLLEKRKENYLAFAETIGQTFGDLLNDQEATMGDYLKATLLLALEALHQWMRIEEGKIIIAGIGKGPIGIAIAVAKVAAMEVAYNAVKGALSKKSTPKHATGGYTNGETTYIAGEAGTEWIAPNWQIKHPLTAPIIARLEAWRMNPVTVSAGAIEASRPSASSNYSSTINKNFQTGNITQMPSYLELKNILAENAKAIKELMNWKPAIAIEEYEKKRDNWKKTTTGGLK